MVSGERVESNPLPDMELTTAAYNPTDFASEMGADGGVRCAQGAHRCTPSKAHRALD